MMRLRRRRAGSAAVLVLGLVAFGATAAPSAVAPTVAATSGVALPSASSPTPEIRLPDVRDLTLPNGARILLAERHDVPLVAFSAYLKGGSLTDPPGKEGVAALTSEMLRKGAGARAAAQIADAVDGVGGSLETGSFLEGMYVAGEFLNQDTPLLVELLTSLLREPTFPDSEFTKLRDQTVEAIRADKDDPGNVYRAYGAAAFYGDHPYGRPSEGDEATVAALTRDDVLRCYRDQFGADRLILVVVGDFAAGDMERRLRSAFGDWTKAGGTLPTIAAPAAVLGRRVLLVDKPDATQGYFWIGNRGIATLDPDRDVLAVANTAFGGSFASSLNTALRVQSGLTYGASCRIQRLAAGGAIGIGSYTKTESVPKAIDLALATLREFRKDGLTEARISRARNYINGQFPTDLETSAQLAGRLASNAFYGLGRDEITGYPARIAAVDSAAVRRVVSRVYPAEKDVVIVIVGNASKLRAAARRYGKVAEIQISRPMLEAMRSARAGAGAR